MRMIWRGKLTKIEKKISAKEKEGQKSTKKQPKIASIKQSPKVRNWKNNSKTASKETFRVASKKPNNKQKSNKKMKRY